MLSFIRKDGLATFFNQLGVFSSLFSFYPPVFVFPGICAMCGKKVLDTKNYKQTSVWQHDDLRAVLRMNVRCEDETNGACHLVTFSVSFHFVLSLTAWTVNCSSPHLCESERFWGGFALLLYTVITNNATGTVAINREALLSLSTPPVITFFADFLYILNSILWLDSLLFRFWFLYVCMYFLSE